MTNRSDKELALDRLVPGAFQGVPDQESVAMARSNHAALDAPGCATRIRI